MKEGFVSERGLGLFRAYRGQGGLSWPSDNRRPITGYGGKSPAEFLASGHGLENRSGRTMSITHLTPRSLADRT